MSNASNLTIGLAVKANNIPLKIINQADTAWVIFSTVLVFIMVSFRFQKSFNGKNIVIKFLIHSQIPGVGYFYAGTASMSKNKLSILFASMIATVIVSIQV